MSDREKLIELLESAESAVYWNSNDKGFIEKIADHLISNGATVGADAKPLKQYLTQIDEYAGLKLKFLVFKADTGERIENCFVLRPDKDYAAVEALRAYAEATDNKTLSDDIYSWVGKGVTVQKWIPVSERMPEVGRDVLVIKDNSDRNMAVWCLYRTIPNEEPYWEDEVGDGLLLKAATHWMPLPELPKECE